MEEKEYDSIQYGNLSYDFVERVQDYLDKTGYNKLQQPDDKEPAYPMDVGKLSDRELGELFDRFGVWYDYVSQDHVILDGIVRQLNAIRENVYSSIKLGTKGAKHDKEDCAKTSQQYIDANKNYLYYLTLLKTADSRQERLSRCISRLSRHIAMRQDGQHHLRRMTNAQSFKPGVDVPRTRRSEKSKDGNASGESAEF